jgi:hypothetical protein
VVFPRTQILNSEKMHGIEVSYIMTLFVVCNISVKYVDLQQRIYKLSFRIEIKSAWFQASAASWISSLVYAAYIGSYLPKIRNNVQKQFFFDYLALENETDRLFATVGNYLPYYAS